MAPTTDPENLKLTETSIRVPLVIPKSQLSTDECAKIPLEGENVTPTPTVINNRKDKIKPKWKRYLGLGLTIVAAMMFSLSVLLIKILDFHPFNLGVWRFLVMIPIPISLLAYDTIVKKQKIFNVLWPLSETVVYLTIQAVVGSNAMVLLFYAVQRLEFADALVIATSAPVFTTLLAWLFLGERAGWFQFLAVLLTLCGVAVICRPPIITGAASYDSNLMIGVLLALGCMLSLATSFVVVRYIRKVHHALVNLCFTVCGLIESFAMAVILDVLSPPTTLQQGLLIFASGILAFGAQTAITLALKYEEAGPVSLVRTTELIFAFVWQLIFLGVTPDIFSILGAGIVICGVILTAVRKMLLGLPPEHKYRQTFKLFLI